MEVNNMKKLNDERIANASAQLTAKLFWVISTLLVISLVVKLISGQSIRIFCLELLCLTASFGYAFIAKLHKGILFIKCSDQALLEIHNSILSKGFMIDFWILIMGELFLILTDYQHIKWYIPYLAIWGIPALILTFYSIKKGWLIWGGEKREKDGKKSLLKRVIIGSLFYGIIAGSSFVYSDGVFHPEGIKSVIGMSIIWGVLFYFSFKFILNLGEKKANKQLESEQNEIEE